MDENDFYLKQMLTFYHQDPLLRAHNGKQVLDALFKDKKLSDILYFMNDSRCPEEVKQYGISKLEQELTSMAKDLELEQKLEYIGAMQSVLESKLPLSIKHSYLETIIDQGLVIQVYEISKDPNNVNKSLAEHYLGRFFHVLQYNDYFSEPKIKELMSIIALKLADLLIDNKDFKTLYELRDNSSIESVNKRIDKFLKYFAYLRPDSQDSKTD